MNASSLRVAPAPAAHPADLRKAFGLEIFTIVYNLLEALVALVASALSGSVALLGFGLDSLIEVTSGGAVLWRLTQESDPCRREAAERLALRIVGFCFVALSLYIAWESGSALWFGTVPDRSLPGIILAAVSLVVMPLLARAKRKAAVRISSASLAADARQTEFCTYLSAILLGGLGVHALWGWWWADALAGLAMIPIIAREGVNALRGKSCICP